MTAPSIATRAVGRAAMLPTPGKSGTAKATERLSACHERGFRTLGMMPKWCGRGQKRSSPPAGTAPVLDDEALFQASRKRLGEDPYSGAAFPPGTKGATSLTGLDGYRSGVCALARWKRGVAAAVNKAAWVTSYLRVTVIGSFLPLRPP